MIEGLLLKLVPFKWFGVAAVVLVLLAVIGFDKVAIARLKVDVAGGQVALADYRREAAVAARAGEAAAREEGRRRTAEIQGALDEREGQLARERADRVIADAATGKLQRAYAAALAAAREARRDPGTAGSGAPAPATDLPADMFSGLVEVARQYRDAAEDAITAGELCERAYDALTPTTLNLPPLKLGVHPGG